MATTSSTRPGEPSAGLQTVLEESNMTAAQAEEELKMPLLEPTDTARGLPVEGEPVRATPSPTVHQPAFPTRQPYQHQPMQAQLDVEDVGSFWKKQRVLMSSWLAVSIVSFTLLVLLDPGSGLLIMAKLASILSIVPPLCYLFPNFSGNLDLETQVKVTMTVGKVSGCLNIITIGFFDIALLVMTTICKTSPPYKDALGNDIPRCIDVWGLMLFFTLFLGTHAWVSLHASQQAHSAQMLLNPVSSGMVHV